MVKKNFIALFFILFTSLNIEGRLQQYDEVVSLGYSCQVAWQLETNGIRRLAYPFDWFHTSYESLIAFINNKGAHFLDLDKINVGGPYPGDPSRLLVKDLLYGIISYHDFLATPPMSNYADIKYKYDRRTKRFFNLLQSNKRVLFVIQDALKSQVENLDYLFHMLYPKLAYTILAVNSHEEYCSPWGNARIENFYLPQIPGDWMGNFGVWTEILSKFTVIHSSTRRPPGEQW